MPIDPMSTNGTEKPETEDVSPETEDIFHYDPYETIEEMPSDNEFLKAFGAGSDDWDSISAPDYADSNFSSIKNGCDLKGSYSEDKRIELNKTNAEIKRSCTVNKGKSWRDMCGNIDPRTSNTKLWNLVKALDKLKPQGEKCNTILDPNGFNLDNDKAAADLIGDHYRQVSKLNFDSGDKLIETSARHSIHSSRSSDLGDPISYLTLQFVPLNDDYKDVANTKINFRYLLSKLNDNECTKRNLLHPAAKLFDTSGLMSPSLIRIKCLLQELWQVGVGWNEMFSEQLKESWPDKLSNLFLEGIQYVKNSTLHPEKQVIAPLPDIRVEQSAPFSIIGVNFAGPLFVEDCVNKQYILLITCAVTRSVHLELVIDWTTDTFLLAFRRFISRRGLCSVVVSENARTLKLAELEIKLIWTVLNYADVKNFYSTKGIKWKYIVERVVWWGGFYE
ncbi:hypothetical protein HNY73_005112 [Argiope bruennichi]|uniref:Uncharacterized protein n=1 Tax=Argiope bruennichi TaxID=94029 RepID=A0A8T0FFG7_ARGBR|nr:hypothetical protein HNY73_005112 [Argiope bruennichi]